MTTDHLGPPRPPEYPPPDRRAKLPPSPSPRWRLTITVMLAAIVVFVALIALGLLAQNRGDKATNSEQTLSGLAGQVAAACASNPTEARKVFGDVCGQAKQIDERPAGQKGDPGKPGSTGAVGPRGPQGEVGPRGQQGPPGAQGKPGITPPCVLLLGGCKGPAGTTGPPGPKGAQGAAGDVGPKGETGPKGDVGPDGVPGAQGPKGDDGPAGAKGDKGEKGDPGPMCPANFIVADRTLVSVEHPEGELTAVCVPDPNPPASQRR